MTLEELQQLSPSSNQFIKHLVDWDIIQLEDTQKPYGEIVYRKCRYFAPWFIVMVAGKEAILQNKFVIHEGTVYGRHHVWLEFESRYIIDGTRSQFTDTAQDIEIFDKVELSIPYHLERSYSLIDWLTKEETSEY